VDITVIWSAVGAVGTVAAAGIAAWAARQSRISAQQALSAATALTAIEMDRRRDELAPEFEITCTVRTRAADIADLRIVLAGGRLERLDAVTVTILDEVGKEHWACGLPDGVTQEEAEEFVWGPWEFNTGASAQVVGNRESRPRPYSRVSGKNWDLLSLQPTRPGRWMSISQEEWRKQWRGQPVRVLLTCHRDGYEPWFAQSDVKVAQGGGPSIRVLEA
jgi:hypothetical protein